MSAGIDGGSPWLGRVGHGDADQLEADAGAVGYVVGPGEEDLGQGAADVAAAQQRHTHRRGRVGVGRPPHRLRSARRWAASPGPQSPPNGTGCTAGPADSGPGQTGSPGGATTTMDAGLTSLRTPVPANTDCRGRFDVVSRADAQDRHETPLAILAGAHGAHRTGRRPRPGGRQTARRTATACRGSRRPTASTSSSTPPNPIHDVASLPGVVTAVRITSPAVGAPACDSCTSQINDNDFSVQQVSPAQLTRLVKLESGRLPDQSDPEQVLASESLAPLGVHVGTVFHVPLASSTQRAAVLSNATITPRGADCRFARRRYGGCGVRIPVRLLAEPTTSTPRGPSLRSTPRAP